MGNGGEGWGSRQSWDRSPLRAGEEVDRALGELSGLWEEVEGQTSNSGHGSG